MYNRYLETQVLSATPTQLVYMLYRGATEAVTASRRNLRAGDIRERSRQIMRAWEIVQELKRSLDHASGGEISRSLDELYAYMQTRLLEANAQQSDPPLAEVEALLTTLSEAWRTTAASASVPAPAPPALEYEPVSCTC
jgi:flagellar protein FliS